jgi:predicted nucleic acid-binding Zn ribbon protein
VRRTAPRPLRFALDRVSRDAAPAGTLAAVQSCWEEVVGPTVAAETEPVAESEGVVTVKCRSAVWAQELELLAGELKGRLNAALGSAGRSPPVSGLRFRVGSSERSRPVA